MYTPARPASLPSTALLTSMTTLAEQWLARMPLEDRVGQMTQLDISLVLAEGCPVRLNASRLQHTLQTQRLGSLLNTPFSGGARCGASGWTASQWRVVVDQIQTEAAAQGLPPLVYGIDSVHGANYVRDATLLPHQLGLAASFDERVAASAGWLTAKDSRAANLPWLFAPILGVMAHPLWPRVFETLGEDPLLVARMGAALVEGMQRSGGAGEAPARAAACMKARREDSQPHTHPMHRPDAAPALGSISSGTRHRATGMTARARGCRIAFCARRSRRPSRRPWMLAHRRRWNRIRRSTASRRLRRVRSCRGCCARRWDSRGFW